MRVHLLDPLSVDFGTRSSDNGAVAEERITFNQVTELLAGSRGVPGKRTFFFLAGDHERWARVWLEKEQLRALSDGIEELLAGLPPATRPTEPGHLSPGDPRGEPFADFRGGRLGLGHDADRDMVVLMVEDGDPEAATPVNMRFSATRAQMKALADRIVEVCSAGRPVCPLCGAPMDPAGHVCVRSNGHHPHQTAAQ